MSLFRKIRDLLDQHGELTFREVCAGVNCFSPQEVDECRGQCHGLGQISEAAIGINTILYPQPLGVRQPFQHQLWMFR